VVHHCAHCLLTGEGSVRRCLVRAAAPYTHPTHRRRDHRCEASGHHLHLLPPATLLPCSSSTTFPPRPHGPCPRLGTHDPRTRPTLLATHHFYRPLSLSPVLLHHLPALARDPPLRCWYENCQNGAVQSCLVAGRGRWRRRLLCGAGEHRPAVADSMTVARRPRTPQSSLPLFCSRASVTQVA